MTWWTDPQDPQPAPKAPVAAPSMVMVPQPQPSFRGAATVDPTAPVDDSKAADTPAALAECDPIPLVGDAPHVAARSQK